MKYVYVAKFEREDDGQYTVYFPDFFDAATCGADLAQAIFMAEDLLGSLLFDLETDKNPFPRPTPLSEFPYKSNDDSSFYNHIILDYAAYKKRVDDTPVRKTVYISKYLNEAAEEKGLNFSQLLRDAIVQELNQ